MTRRSILQWAGLAAAAGSVTAEPPAVVKHAALSPALVAALPARKSVLDNTYARDPCLMALHEANDRHGNQ